MSENMPELDPAARDAVQRIRAALEPPPDLAQRLRPAIDARLAAPGAGRITWIKTGVVALVVAVVVPVAWPSRPPAAGDEAPPLAEPVAPDPVPALAPVTPPVAADLALEPSANAGPASRAAVGERVPSPPAKPEDPLAAELALLAQAREALRTGDPERALVLLARHERKYRRGALADERDVARVLALCDAGRLEQARERATGFARRRPGSHLLQRLRSSCVADALGDTD